MKQFKTALLRCGLAVILSLMICLTTAMPLTALSYHGDINGDSKVNSSDLVLLCKWLLGVEEGGKDVNGDGKFDIRDLVDLKIVLSQFKEDVEKFEVITENKDFNNVDTYTLGDIFGVALGYSVNNSEVNVEFSTEDGVNCEFIKNEKWEESTVKFSGTGSVTITIYELCLPTVITLNIVNIDKFAAIENVEINLAEKNSLKLGEIFTAIEGISINSENVEVTAENCVYTQDYSDWKNSTVTFSAVGTAVLTIKENSNIATNSVSVINYLNGEKFDVKFPNTDKFLYRVGNINEISLESLFGAKEGITVDSSEIDVTVTAISGEVTSTYSANTSDWKKSKIKFDGTGVAKITVFENSKPTDLVVEVIKAKNATTATSATNNDVVLLSDMGFSTIDVSNGYTLHGNGFTLSSPNDITGDSMSSAYITLNNGSLDNVQVVCPDYSLQILYDSQAKVSDNVDPTAEWRYKNFRSAVTMNGNSKITNSRISGGRATVYVRSGFATLENTMLQGGAIANIHVSAAQELILRNMTLVQRPTQATVNDTSKILMGFSVVFVCGEDGSSTPLTLEGTLNQFAWANDSYMDYVPSGADQIVTKVLEKDEYKHNFSLNGAEAADWLNLGFAYMPAGLGYSVSNPTINDERTDKEEKPYGTVDVSVMGTTTYVYSYVNSNGTDVNLQNEPTYISPDTGIVLRPDLSFTDTKDGINFLTAFDEQKGWISTLEVDLDTVGNYSFLFENLHAIKNGQKLAYTVKSANGSIIDKSQAVALTGSGVTDYTLVVVDGETTHEMPFILIAKMTKIDPPKKEVDVVGDPLLVVKSKDSDWSCAVPALTDTQIKYWSVAEGAYKTLTLSDLTPTTVGKQNATNNYWNYTDTNNDFTLKITCSAIHEGKGVYGMPVVVDNNGTKEMYFTISSTTGYVSTGTSARAVTLTYEFTDNNGGTLTFDHAWNCVRQDMIDAGKPQYLYSDFVEGTMAEATSGSACVTPDTLITLADGSQKKVNELKGDEMLLVWNMETGKLDLAPIMFIDSETEAEYEVVKLRFSDGTEVNVIYEHGFWDYDLNKYVYLDSNAAQYIGHTFAKQNGDKLEKVTLVDVIISTETTTAWSPVTVGHLCYFTNGMLSMPGGVGGLFNIFEVVSETMTYDYEAIEKDIETYGLYTYEELNAIAPLSEEMFYAAGGQYLKISIGKGNMSVEDLVYMIERYSKFI